MDRSTLSNHEYVRKELHLCPTPEAKLLRLADEVAYLKNSADSHDSKLRDLDYIVRGMKKKADREFPSGEATKYPHISRVLLATGGTLTLQPSSGSPWYAAITGADNRLVCAGGGNKPGRALTSLEAAAAKVDVEPRP